MSKKIAKRSLALGALMAFVITGSAMAAEVYDKTYPAGEIITSTGLTVEGSGLISSAGDLTIKSTGNNAVTADGGKLTIIANGDIVLDASNANKNGNAILAYSDLDITAKGGDMTLSGDNRVIRVVDGADVALTANDGTITLDGSNTNDWEAVKVGYSRWVAKDKKFAYLPEDNSMPESSSLKVTAKNVEIIGKNKRVLTAYTNGKIDIDAADTLVITHQNNGDAVKVFGPNSSIELSAQNTTINGGVMADGGAKTSSIIIDSGEKTTINGCVKTYGEDTAITVKGNENTTINGSVQARNGIGGDSVNVYGHTITIDSSLQSKDSAWSILTGGNDYDGLNKPQTVNIGDANTESVKVTGKGYGAFAQYGGAKINITGKIVEFDVKGQEYKVWKYIDSSWKEVTVVESGTGIYAGNSQHYANAATVNVNADKTIIKATGVGIEAYSHGIVNIKNGLELSAPTAIMARGNSNINVNKSGNGVVKIDGDIVFAPTGQPVVDDNHVGANAFIDLNLTTADSYLKGAILVNDKKDTGQTKADVEGMKLGLSNGAKLIVTGDSFASEIYGNGGNVVLSTLEDSNNTATTALSVAKLDIAKNTNDNLAVSGDEKLTAELEKSDNPDADAKAALTTIQNAVTGAGKDNVATYKTAEGKILGSYVLNENGKVELQESSKSDAVSNAGMNLKAHWRAHMNDMNKRMGELRYSNGEHGVWTRMVRGESEYENSKMQYNQYQLGYDEKAGDWTVGAAVTYSEGDSNYGQGSTDDKSTAFAVYGSKLNKDGSFVDVIARYANLESELEDTVYGEGDYDTDGYSISAEYGKRFAQTNGLWIEPQVELTYGTVDSADMRFSDGSKVHYGSMDSLIGRVGFSIGKDIEEGNLYARASYLYDFDGETETTFSNGTVSGKPVAEDFGGGWWEVGVGANIHLSKATYLYADVERTFGGEVDTNWQWNLGFRYSF